MGRFLNFIGLEESEEEQSFAEEPQQPLDFAEVESARGLVEDEDPGTRVARGGNTMHRVQHPIKPTGRRLLVHLILHSGRGRTGPPGIQESKGIVKTGPFDQIDRVEDILLALSGKTVTRKSTV